MRTHFLLILTGFLTASSYSSAQNETNHWMLGYNAGLDFSSGAPVPEQGCVLSTFEGTASISDPVTGNLLMYTEGTTVYTANHIPMPNGAGLFGNYSTTQSAIIVPKPGSSTLFYIFTADAIPSAIGYNYSMVDMTLNGGLGDVIPAQKNVSMFGPGGEQLSAVKHANCTDWWIMTKEDGNNVYRAYLLTSAGLSAPVSSSIGISISGIAGQAKFSPDGTKYALSTVSNFNAFVQLFDFDNATGLLSNLITLVDVSNQSSYGLSFSGDNSKLYATRGWNANDIYQYDLSSGVASTIITSATLIGSLPIYAQFQLGKDFKIYIANYGTSTLSVINNPNALGASCGFSVGTVPIAGNSTFGLCNFPESYFNQSDPCPPGITVQSTNVSCFDANDGTAFVQVGNSNGPYTFNWSPGSAMNDTVTGLAPGTYTVTVTDAAGNIATASVVITAPPPFIVAISGNNMMNPGESTILTTNITGGIPAYSYQWSTNSSDTLPSVSFTFESGDNVQVIVTDNNGCTATATLEFLPRIPNVITSNGDGINDVFKIYNLPSASSLRIMNRWGNPVFTTDNYTNDWTGDKSDGTYFYVLKLPDGRNFSGFVQVITNR